MATWRVARALDTLLSQLNASAPGRNKASDGSIGDTSHQNRSSDHNPWYGPGIVTARDFTHDPAGGLDCQWLAERLVASRDSRIKYVIWNRRIIDSRQGNRPWQWVAYDGTNPHTKHLHLSVMDASSCDDTRTWNLGAPTPSQEEDMPLTDEDVTRVAAAVWERLIWPLAGGAPNKAWVWLAGANQGAWDAASAATRVEALAKVIAADQSNDLDEAAAKTLLENAIRTIPGPPQQIEVSPELLTDGLVTAMHSLPDEAFDRFAQASANESDRRAAARANIPVPPA